MFTANLKNIFHLFLVLHHFLCTAVYIVMSTLPQQTHTHALYVLHCEMSCCSGLYSTFKVWMYQMFCKLKLARLLQLTKTKLRCEKTVVPINDKAKTKQTFDIKKETIFYNKMKMYQKFLIYSNLLFQQARGRICEFVYWNWGLHNKICCLCFNIYYKIPQFFPHIEGLE